MKKLVLLSGKKNSGKTTLANFIKNNIQYNTDIFAISTPIKNITFNFLKFHGISYEPNDKENIIKKWNIFKKILSNIFRYY